MADSELRTTVSPPVTTVSSTTNTDAWKYRRRFMLWITTFDMGVVILALLFGKHESVGQMAVLGGFGSLTAIFGFYVGGAVWDDHSTRLSNIRGLEIAQNAAPDAQPTPPCDKGP